MLQAPPREFLRLRNLGLALCLAVAFAVVLGGLVK
jgi:hypothetical protein